MPVRIAKPILTFALVLGNVQRWRRRNPGITRLLWGHIVSHIAATALVVGVTALVTACRAPVFQIASVGATESCAPLHTPEAGSEIAHTVSASPETNSGDLAILDSMLRQHARAMSLANLALQNAQDSRVRRIALRMAEAHSGVMQRLRSWRSSWFTQADAAVSNAEFDDLGSILMECSSETFDRAFLVLLRAELQAEVDEARIAQKKAAHAGLQNLATSLVRVRTEEIASIDTLLAAL
ncbi:MAG TPA: DUF305 domain-containing protein [Thermomicrobiales bacterium]|nr:DUF305 domain-containing protein [Thermomicrobiales bacterium]